MPNQCSAQTVFPWLRANLGKKALAPLTTTDAMALRAAVSIVELYNHTEDSSLLQAFTKVVESMQRGCWYFAYHAIAHVGEWQFRDKVWQMAGLSFEPIFRAPRCEHEPREETV